MKTNRNLSGIYFRSKVGDKWDNVCFEELPAADQEEIMQFKDKEWLMGMIRQLVAVLNEIGEQFDIVKQ